MMSNTHHCGGGGEQNRRRRSCRAASIVVKELLRMPSNAGAKTIPSKWKSRQAHDPVIDDGQE